jgi:hypothetical protein
MIKWRFYYVALGVMRRVVVVLSSYKTTLNNCKVCLVIKIVKNINYIKYC